jgi:hypothetical protein
MDATNNATANNATGNTAFPRCCFTTVAKWAKGEHEAIIPESWSNLLSGERIAENITLADFDVLMSMAMRLECYLKEEDLRKLSFHEACKMFVYIVNFETKWATAETQQK